MSIRAREAKFELDFQPDKKALKATSSFGIATTGDHIIHTHTHTQRKRETHRERETHT